MDRQYKVIDDIVPYDKPLKLGNVQHLLEEELRIFQTTNDVMMWLD